MLQWPKSGCQRNTCCDCVQRAAGAYGMGQRSLFKRESFMRARPKCEVLRWKRSTWKHQGRPGHCLGHMQSYFGSISFVPCTVPEAHLRLRRGQNACPDQAPCHRICSCPQPPWLHHHHLPTTLRPDWIKLDQRWASDPNWASHIPFPDNGNEILWNWGRWEPCRGEADFYHTCLYFVGSTLPP